MTKMRLVENLVIGGGPAGSMAAIRLAASARHVLLLEKESGPHDKVCGEFLSREAVEYLHRAGLSPRELGATVIRNVRLSAGCRVAEAPLPFEALSLSRRALDRALLARAEQLGSEVLRGAAVETLTQQGAEWIAMLSNGTTLRALNVFLATGKHDIRGFVRAPGKQSDLVGFKSHWKLAPNQVTVLRDFMDLYLFPGGYGGLSLIENDAANLCLVVRRTAFRMIGGWPQLLGAIQKDNRHLRRLLDNSIPLWPRPLAISPIPYGYLAGESHGIWRLGDQAAVIPSFTGDGISIALHSGALAVRMFLASSSADEYHRVLRIQLARSMSLATWLSRAAVTGTGRAAGLAAATFFPGAARWVTALTRIPESSLVADELPMESSGFAARQSA